MPADDEIMFTPNISRAISRQERRRNDSILWHKCCELAPANWMWMGPGGPLNYSRWWFRDNLACGSQDRC
jgi:hypothetical protein